MPDRPFRIGRRVFNEMREHDPLQALKTYTGPLLIIHGTDDESISYEDTLRYFKELHRSETEFLTIEGGTHTFPREPHTSTVAEAICDFFSHELDVK